MTKRDNPIPLIWLIFVAVVVYIIVDNVWADDDHHGHHDDGGPVSVSTDVAGSNTTVKNSSKSLALGRSSFDVDINQCMGSEAWDTVLVGKQKLVLNWTCMAEFYLRVAAYDLAAMALCNTEILDEFDDEAACELAHDFAPQEVEPPPDPPVSSDQHNEDIETVQMQQSALVMQVDELTTLVQRAPAPRPRVTQQAQTSKYTDDQFDAVWAALKGDEDE